MSAHNPLPVRVAHMAQTIADDLRELGAALDNSAADALEVAERIREGADTLAWLVRTALRPDGPELAALERRAGAAHAAAAALAAAPLLDRRMAVAEVGWVAAEARAAVELDPVRDAGRLATFYARKLRLLLFIEAPADVVRSAREQLERHAPAAAALLIAQPG